MKFSAAVFVSVITGVPLGQAAWEVVQGEPVQALEVFSVSGADGLRSFEADLRDASFLYREWAPRFQSGLLALGKGNAKSIVGGDGWLFYSKDLDWITARGFMADRQASPVATIVDVHEQFAARGIPLLFVPVPAKGGFEMSHLASGDTWPEVPTNVDYPVFLEELRRAGVDVVDLVPGIADLRVQAGEAYLARDTHWTPATMEWAAAEIGQRVGELLETEAHPVPMLTQPATVQAQGDLVEMLRLSADALPFETMGLETRRVVYGDGAPVVADPGADVLLMGDSFTGVYSDPRFEMGEHAGLMEHIARAIGAPLDVIAIPGGGVRATRESFARRPAAQKMKKVVVWQMSQRDLLDRGIVWGPVDLWPAGERSEATTEPVQVLAELVEASRIPLEFAYEFCLVIHEYRVLEVKVGELPAQDVVWVAHVGMEDYDSRPGNQYEVGVRQVLRLENVIQHFDLESTSFVDDTDAGRTIWYATQVRAE